MWKSIQDKFKNSPSQMLVVSKFVQIGLSVKNDFEGVPRIFCLDIEIKANSVAASVGVDRRVVLETVKKIASDPELFKFFAGLKPTANLGTSDSTLGFGRIEVIPEDANKPGIISGILNIISEHGLNVRQVIVEDPEITDNPKALIVTDKPIPSEIIPAMRKVAGVSALVIL